MRVPLNLMVRIWYQKIFRCPLGSHMTVDATGNPANFCCICGYQLNTTALKKYIVALRDGHQEEVSAINERHAKSLVMYGDNLQVDATGKPIGNIKVHEANIQSVTSVM